MNENDLNVVDRFKGQKMSSYEMSSDAMSVSIIITGISAHHWPSPSQFPEVDENHKGSSSMRKSHF